MRISLKFFSATWKFLPNPEKRIFKTKGEAFRDFCKVSGASVLWQVGTAIILLEFGFPTPDIVYDLKRMISPDFDMFCKYGELAEFQLGFENKLRSIKTEEKRYIEKGHVEKSPEARFGGDRMSVRKTAGRVEPSQITSFLCFTCGDVFNNNVEYHRHLMEHQAVSLIYQLYYLEHEYKNLTPEERLARKQESPAPSMSARRNTDPGKNLPIDAGKRHIRYSEDTEVKADTKNGRAKPNTQETVKPPVKAVRRGSFNVGAPPSKKSKLAKDDTASVLKFSNSKGYLLMKTHEMFCHICPGNPSFKFPLNALSHWVTEHNATISRTELQFFSQNVLQQSITNSPGTACPVCDMEFSKTVGYLHALEHHLAELVETLISVKKVEMVDELIINVSATLPSQPEAVIRISANVVQK